MYDNNTEAMRLERPITFGAADALDRLAICAAGAARRLREQAIRTGERRAAERPATGSALAPSSSCGTACTTPGASSEPRDLRDSEGPPSPAGLPASQGLCNLLANRVLTSVKFGVVWLCTSSTFTIATSTE